MSLIRAFYALLLTDARYRTDYNQPDDSIINIAASSLSTKQPYYQELAVIKAK